MGDTAKPAREVEVGDVVRHPRPDLWPDTTFRVTAIFQSDNTIHLRLRPVTPGGLGGTGNIFPSPDDAVAVVQSVASASAALRAVKGDRDEAIRAALRVGLSLRDVAAAANLSHQRVAAIRDHAATS